MKIFRLEYNRLLAVAKRPCGKLHRGETVLRRFMWFQVKMATELYLADLVSGRILLLDEESSQCKTKTRT